MQTKLLMQKNTPASVRPTKIVVKLVSYSFAFLQFTGKNLACSTQPIPSTYLQL